MIETKPGDVIIFTERLPHRSTLNQTNESRRIIYGVYNPAIEGDKRAKYYDDKRQNINDARYLVGNPHAVVK
jgi:ectoine hydroxylase-related dioxygenase (phytanoyl-CoA dioxygenase family)